MRMPIRSKGPAAVGASIPAPVGGWNTRDGLAAMKPSDAVTLDNWFPDATQVSLRRGYVPWVTGIPAAVETLMEWGGASARKLFAAADAAIYDVTASGTVGAAVVSGVTSPRWQWVNFATPGGQFLCAVNGQDMPRCFDGTTWTTPGITGATASKFVSVMSHMARLWFVEKDSLRVWYLPPNSIAGPASSLDLGPLCRLGGQIVACGSWTHDGGAGADDTAVFVTDRGEVVIYRGTDPSSAATWGLVGVFRIDTPVGRRCLVPQGSELLVLTSGGLMPISAILPYPRAAQRKGALTDKIGPAFSAAAQSYGSSFGWQLQEYPRGNWLVVNVPVRERVEQQQYVANTITGAWCRFTGMNAGCWGLLQDDLFFGGNNGTVYKADTGNSDDGSVITADLKTAFTYFGTPGQLKRFTMVRPLLTSDGEPQPSLALNVDFGDEAPANVLTATAAPGGLWDESDWDETDWAADRTLRRDWYAVDGLGYAAAVRMRVATSGMDVSVAAFDVLMMKGGLL
ncbi:hypothetical protein [Azospirillum sp. sgz302134]